jgi:hypothetical protein
MAGPTDVRAAEPSRSRAARTACAGTRRAPLMPPAPRMPHPRCWQPRGTDRWTSSNTPTGNCSRRAGRVRLHFEGVCASQLTVFPDTSTSSTHGPRARDGPSFSRRSRQRGASPAAAPRAMAREYALVPLRGHEPRATYRPRFCFPHAELRRLVRGETYGTVEKHAFAAARLDRSLCLMRQRLCSTRAGTRKRRRLCLSLRWQLPERHGAPAGHCAL